jgi:isopentenyl-diphosphate delta-isomerase
MITAGAEQVVLLGEDRTPVGVADKAAVHTTDTPLHLAFSCYVHDAEGRLLMTRRALGKRTWPGVWTNSCCGHPAPGEQVEDAVVRRVEQELGLSLADLSPALPDFAYRAVDAGGVVENEVCPVFTARAAADPSPDPEEVCEWRWTAWEDVVEVARRTPWLLSPWSVLQITELAAGPRPA